MNRDRYDCSLDRKGVRVAYELLLAEIDQRVTAQAEDVVTIWSGIKEQLIKFYDSRGSSGISSKCIRLVKRGHNTQESKSWF